jgi:hypothetical protein
MPKKRTPKQMRDRAQEQRDKASTMTDQAETMRDMASKMSKKKPEQDVNQIAARIVRDATTRD